jgi:hypothetical protein
MIMTPIKLGLIITGTVVATATTTYGVARSLFNRRR